jgi:coenzyme F420-reducing hydrogenase delta subunit
MFAVTRELIHVLGYSQKRFQMDQVAVGDGESWVKKVQSFVDGLNGKQGVL